MLSPQMTVRDGEVALHPADGPHRPSQAPDQSSQEPDQC